MVYSKIYFSAMMVMSSLAISAQDVKKAAESTQTKMEVFSSKTGSILKFTDIKLPNLKSGYGGVTTRIRKLTNSTATAYFYQIQKEDKYNNSTASIEYNDLLEVMKAFSQLKEEYPKDIDSNPEYLENRFITEDGFQLGYYVGDGKSHWYIKLEKYGSDDTLFFSDVATVETAFKGALSKIEDLKK